MTPRSLSDEDIVRFINNRNNPKSMDYYFGILLNIRNGNCRVHSDSSVEISMHSITCPQIEAYRQAAGSSIYLQNKCSYVFTLDMFENRILPKGMMLAIRKRAVHDVDVLEPRAGEKVEVEGGSSYYKYKYFTTLGMYKKIRKPLLMYSRKNWERKGDIKPARPKKTKAPTPVPDNETTQAV